MLFNHAWSRFVRNGSSVSLANNRSQLTLSHCSEHSSFASTRTDPVFCIDYREESHSFHQKYGGFSGSSRSFTKASSEVSFWNLTPQILIAGLYGVSRSQSLVFVTPISPRSTTSPGPVRFPGANKNRTHIILIYASRSCTVPPRILVSSPTNPVQAAQACRMISEARLVFALSHEVTFPYSPQAYRASSLRRCTRSD